MACVIFAHYCAVLTSLMSNAPQALKMRSFSDVLEHDFQVMVKANSAYVELFRNSESDMQKVYSKMIKDEDSFYSGYTSEVFEKLQGANIKLWTQIGFVAKTFKNDVNDIISPPCCKVSVIFRCLGIIAVFIDSGYSKVSI